MPHTVTRQPTLPVMIDLTTISTPKEAAITVSPGKIDPEVVEQGREARVRSLPIVGHNSEFFGAISVKQLAWLAANKSEIVADHAIRIRHENRPESLNPGRQINTYLEGLESNLRPGNPQESSQ